MLGCLLAAPTVVEVGGAPRLAARLRLGDFAFLLQCGADALGMDADAGDIPRFTDPAFAAWMSGPGARYLLWCALRRDNPVTLAGCAELADDAVGVAAVKAAALRRARFPVPPSRGTDVARLDWSGVVCRYYSEGHRMPAEVAELTLDQAYAIATGGKGFTAGGDADEREAFDDLQRRWEAERPRTLEEDLTALGLVRVEADDV